MCELWMSNRYLANRALAQTCAANNQELFNGQRD